MIFPLSMMALQGQTVDLVRGAAIPGAPANEPGYWAVADTYLDRTEPGMDHGGGFSLLGGDGRTILIRFGDLQRAVGPHRRITSATLVLTPSGGEVPALRSVTNVAKSWGEGPASTLAHIFAQQPDPKKDPKTKEAKPTAAKGSATWNERRSGFAAWDTAGTPDGAAVAATGTAKEKTFEISGLGETVQGWLQKPWTNHGLALAFKGDVEFFSSQSPSGRPTLVLTTEPTPIIDVARPDLAVTAVAKKDGKWTATVKNEGAAPSTATKGHWVVDGKPGPEASLDQPITPNGEANLVYGGPEPTADPSEPTIGFELDNAAEPNDRMDVFATGKPVTLKIAPQFANQAPEAVNVWNETVAPESRFSFAPEGVTGRVTLQGIEVAADGAADMTAALREIGRALGLPSPAPVTSDGRGSGDLYPGLMGYGDTRFDGTIPGKLALPYEPYFDAATETALLEPTGLLSATDVGRLNDGATTLPFPRAVLLRVVDLAGRPLGSLDMTLQAPGGTAVPLRTSENGTALLPSRGADGPFGTLAGDLSNGTLILKATQHGVTETAFLKAWRMSDAFRRSASPAVVMEVRLDLPMLPLESGTNLAADKVVSDSANSEPAALAGLTDGDDATAVDLPSKAGGWVEIDLGRDRTLGEIALEWADGPSPDRFDVMVYSTGQRAEEALPWARELDSAWARTNRGDGKWVAYRAPVQRVRYLRIVNRSGGAGKLAGIRAVPVKLATQP